MDKIKSIDELKQQYDTLNRKKIQAQTQLESATQQLEELQNEAKEQFGTCDIDELKSMLEKMERENEQRRSDYQSLLDGIERDLASVEDAASGAANPKGE